LKDKPTGNVELWHKEAKDAFVFAADIWRALTDSGWTAQYPKPIPPLSERHHISWDLTPGILGPLFTVIAKQVPLTAQRENTALCALRDALKFPIDNIGVASTSVITAEPTMPDGLILIIVGEK
jgi:hypothetical protein